MLTDIEEPVAFDRTPLTAAVAVAVGPRTPFSPERTFVTLPRGNPEIEPLAGASERQGATYVVQNLAVRRIKDPKNFINPSSESPGRLFTKKWIFFVFLGPHSHPLWRLR